MTSGNAPFDSSNEHEINHISSMYLEEHKVRALLKSFCRDPSKCQCTCSQLHAWLAEQGFNKIKM